MYLLIHSFFVGYYATCTSLVIIHNLYVGLMKML